MVFGEEWSGRLVLVDPKRGVGRKTGLRFVRTLVRQVGPAAYSRYLLRRLRSRVGAIERARVARELHDGVIQSLIGLEMKVQVLRGRRAPCRRRWPASWRAFRTSSGRRCSTSAS